GVAEEIQYRSVVWRIEAGIVEEMFENPVMEYSIPGANRCVAILEGFPGKADPGLDIFVIVVVHLFSCARTDYGEIERPRRIRIHQQVGKIPIFFKRHPIELVTQTNI